MKTCFVLEGGALRGLFTAGVLDYLYENNVNIDSIIGVSAGALFGVNYFSKQPYRVLRYNKKYCNDKRYISIRSLILTGNIVNKNFAYYKVTNYLDPFDEKQFEESNKDYYAVLTNIVDGKAEYVKIEKPVEQMEELRASSAMPMFSRVVKIGGKKYLDGAISDSIPVKKALDMDYDRVVVVQTQPIEYRKKENSPKMIKKIQRRYKMYPKLVELLLNRPSNYNKSLEEIIDLEKQNKIFVIRPSSSVEVDPIKKTEDDLQRIYDLGVSDAEKCYKKLIKFLK